MMCRYPKLVLLLKQQETLPGFQEQHFYDVRYPKLVLMLKQQKRLAGFEKHFPHVRYPKLVLLNVAV